MSKPAIPVTPIRTTEYTALSCTVAEVPMIQYSADVASDGISLRIRTHTELAFLGPQDVVVLMDFLEAAKEAQVALSRRQHGQA